MNSSLQWYGFHTDHDFAYLLRLLLGGPLPMDEKSFYESLEIQFPNFYDVKVIADSYFSQFRGSLSSLSEKLTVKRDDKNEH